MFVSYFPPENPTRKKQPTLLVSLLLLLFLSMYFSIDHLPSGRCFDLFNWQLLFLKVNNQVNMMKTEIQGCVANVSVSIFASIEDKVSGELLAITERLKSGEFSAEKGIEATMKKSDRYHSEIQILRDDAAVKIEESRGEFAQH